MLIFRTNIVLILAGIILWCGSARGSEFFIEGEADAFLKTKWTTEEGLPQNTVKGIVQTRDGYIWVATLGGLARFDGIKFTIFNSANTPVINNNRIVSLFEDGKDGLWFNTEDGEVIRYKNGVFVLMLTIPKSQALQTDNENGIWTVDKNSIIRFDIQNPNIQTTFSLEDENLDKMATLKDGSHNKVWFSSSRGLSFFENGTFSNVSTPSDIINKILLIESNSQNGQWLLTKNGIGSLTNGIYQNRLKLNEINPQKIEISATYSKKDDSFWVNVGTNLYQVTKNEIKTFSYLDISNVGSRAMMIDREGNIWLGTKGEGLLRLKKKQIKLFANTLNDLWMETKAIIEDADGTIWIATYNGLVRKQQDKIDVFTKNDGLLSNLVQALAIDKQGVLWIGTPNGLSNFKNGKFTHFVSEKDRKGSKYSIQSLYFDKQENLWIGYRTRGLEMFRDGKFTSYTQQQGLVENDVHNIFQDRKGVLWISTSNGLSRFENGVFTNFTIEQGLSNNYVRDIYEDADGTLWIGTYGGGINRFRDGKFSPITVKQGLFEDTVSRILVDDNDNFWILGNHGIFSVNRKALNDVADGKEKSVISTVFGKADGMKISEGSGGNQPAGWKMRDGKLWFPMIQGGVIIDIKPHNIMPPPVFIEDVFLEETKLETSDQIRIKSGKERLEIHYTGLSFAKPEQVQFRYRLEGFEKDWQTVGTRRTAFYPYLPSGNYKFSVMAMNSDGVWSETPATLEINVEAPFWQTWWFYILALILVLVIFFLIFRMRLRQIENSRRKQQEFARQLINAQETERQRIAIDLHDGIGQDLLIIKNWALYGLSKTEGENNPKKQFDEISDTATHALDETRTIARNLRPQHLQRFGLTETLQNMITQVENSAGINFETDIQGIDGLFTEEDELSIYRIIQESLNNIVKHSNSQRAKIEIIRASNSVGITIQDFGKGFDVDHFFGAKSKQVSFGLASIAERVLILGGNFKVNSTVGKGTTISVFLNV